MNDAQRRMDRQNCNQNRFADQQYYPDGYGWIDANNGNNRYNNGYESDTGGNRQGNNSQVPEEYANDPELYYAIQASLNQDNQANMNTGGPASGMQDQNDAPKISLVTENADFQDELDIMVRKNDGNNNSSTYLNDEALNRINKSKT